MENDIRIVRGENAEGLFWIVVFQYGKAEFRCQHISTWVDTETGLFLSQNAKNLTLGEIVSVLPCKVSQMKMCPKSRNQRGQTAVQDPSTGHWFDTVHFVTPDPICTCRLDHEYKEGISQAIKDYYG